MRYYLLVFSLLIFSLSFAQNTVTAGFSIGPDMGLKVDKTDNYQLTKNNTWSFGGDLYAGIHFPGDINIYPRMAFTIFNGEYKMINYNGSDNPLGEFTAFENTGTAPLQFYTYDYTTEKSRARTAHLTFGVNITKTFFEKLELGGGIFMTRRRTLIKDYISHDTYKYYGSSGTHTQHYQLDEYTLDTVSTDKRPSSKTTVIASQPEISFLARYYFVNNPGFRFGPELDVFIGKDVFYVFRFTFRFTLKNNENVTQ
ncbi:MAG: hypothetical protein A2W91_18870 [Bacteroidetes bacterium GWF2_38_335]|nr:MAG: hypothetical protein A2W91_18870 [Bacteroidetes bacterium GWF2_38_335]OFY78139.1 MAG: hypothetical protein A2281_04195 [Bacteroidetes bacterium RIFOXYA12_FULL_38_20]HBS88706.1 hypothetical protein [Bacteroidales bacterium]